MKGARRRVDVEIDMLHLYPGEYVQVSTGQFDDYIMLEFKVNEDGALEIRSNNLDITLLPFEED